MKKNFIFKRLVLLFSNKGLVNRCHFCFKKYIHTGNSLAWSLETLTKTLSAPILPRLKAQN